MAKEIEKMPSLELAAQKGGFGNLMRAIAEDSPEVLTTVLSAAITSRYGYFAGAASAVAVKVLHAGLKGHGWQQIATELQELKDKGKVKEEFEDSDLGRACIAELLEAIDKNPDPRRINALKNTFLKIAREPGTEADAIRNQQILHVVGGLSSGEIVLLATMYRVGGVNLYNGAPQWMSDMARETGFGDEGLIQLAEEPLIEKRLITSRHYPDRSGISWGRRNRLTQLGERVCEFIQTG